MDTARRNSSCAGVAVEAFHLFCAHRHHCLSLLILYYNLQALIIIFILNVFRSHLIPFNSLYHCVPLVLYACLQKSSDIPPLPNHVMADIIVLFSPLGQFNHR